jgi:hypothetical protein
MGPRNRIQGMNSASLCSLAGRYDNPLPPRFLAPIDFLKISALFGSPKFFLQLLLVGSGLSPFNIPTHMDPELPPITAPGPNYSSLLFFFVLFPHFLVMRRSFIIVDVPPCPGENTACWWSAYILFRHTGDIGTVPCTHGRRNFKDTNPLMSSSLVIFVWGGVEIL